MNIRDKEGDMIPAVVKIGYKGYTLSMSTLLDSWGHGAIITPEGDILPESFECTPKGIAAAARRIDRMVRSKS